jgi:hypothetical protein
MNIKEIEILTEKYFECLTSIEEERQLKDFFASGDFPDEMKSVAAMFGYFEMEKKVTASEDFSHEVIRQIEGKQFIPFYQNRRFWYYFTGIAASILFLVAFFFESRNHLPNKTYTAKETQLAYLQTRKTLAYVSEKFNMGVKPLNEIEKIEKNTEVLGQISKFGQGLDKVNANVMKIESGVNDISKLSKFNIIIEP